MLVVSGPVGSSLGALQHQGAWNTASSRVRRQALASVGMPAVPARWATLHVRYTRDGAGWFIAFRTGQPNCCGRDGRKPLGSMWQRGDCLERSLGIGVPIDERRLHCIAQEGERAC